MEEEAVMLLVGIALLGLVLYVFFKGFLNVDPFNVVIGIIKLKVGG